MVRIFSNFGILSDVYEFFKGSNFGWMSVEINLFVVNDMKVKMNSIIIDLLKQCCK